MEVLKLFYSSSVQELGCDLDKILSILRELEKTDVLVELVDTFEMDKRELHEFYVSEAVHPTSGKHYRIGHIFGTQRNAGCFFGREQPALLVYDIGKKPSDIFPHTKKGRRVTIQEYLEEKLAKKKREAYWMGKQVLSASC